jgi:N-sulfoglucosamine sulfohydrolase
MFKITRNNPRSILSSFLVSPLSLLFSGELQGETNQAGEGARPNILLIVSDDHGTNDLGCYGNEAIKTPNLDKLAEEGIKFTNAYCTSASSSPSRSVILTGLYNHANGQYGLSRLARVKGHIYSLPDMLKTHANYFTVRVGKFHIGREEIFGFDKVIKTNRIINRNSAAMADSVKPFIESDSKQPFFIYFCPSDPHRGHGVVEDHPLQPDRFGNRMQGYEGINPVKFSEEDIEVPSYLPDNFAVRAELAQYYESVARLDQGIGKLLNYIRESGKWNNTVVIYISDNGIAFPGAKTNVYEPALKLPCLVKPTKKTTVNTSHAMISWVDITPTILDFAGILEDVRNEILTGWRINHQPYKSAKNGLHGRSFVQALYSNDIEGWDTVYATHNSHEETMYYPMRVIITRKYKLIWNMAHPLPFPHASDLWRSATWQNALEEGTFRGKPVSAYMHRPEYELYDLTNDPLEHHNLAGKEEYQDVINKLKGQVKHFQQETDDPWLVKWVHE